MLFWFGAEAFEENHVFSVPSAHLHLTIFYQGTSPQGGLVEKSSTCRIPKSAKMNRAEGGATAKAQLYYWGCGPQKVVAVQPAGQASLWSQPRSHMLPPLTLRGKDDGTCQHEGNTEGHTLGSVSSHSAFLFISLDSETNQQGRQGRGRQTSELKQSNTVHW